MKFKYLLAATVAMFCATFCEANNISVQKVSLTDTNTVAKTVAIKFNLSWENSWRDAVNWDAAWVFIKFKRADGSWGHAKLSASGNSIGGSNAAMSIVVPDDKLGTFIHRAGNGDGKNELTDVKLSWNYGADGLTDITSTEVRVFVTEMVYVPEGIFVMGDGSGGGYTMADQQHSPDYVQVSDSTAAPMSHILGYSQGNYVMGAPLWVDGKRGIGTSNGTFDYPNFPVGYKAFYCMKYEVTQGQYADMLNAISVTAENGASAGNVAARYMPDANNLNNNNGGRFTITLTDSLYGADRPDRACNGLLGLGLSFADWAGLRPMSEFEYEKACRGPLAPTPNETASGATAYETNSNYGVSGPEDGTETIDNHGHFDTFGGATYTGHGDGGFGPHRVGVFATPTSDRLDANASYYGIMDLADGEAEYVVMSDNNLQFQTINGDGLLPVSGGLHDVSSWPNVANIDGAQVWVKNAAVSGRTLSNNGNMRTSAIGFRGVRSVPSEN